MSLYNSIMQKNTKEYNARDVDATRTLGETLLPQLNFFNDMKLYMQW